MGQAGAAIAGGMVFIGSGYGTGNTGFGNVLVGLWPGMMTKISNKLIEQTIYGSRRSKNSWLPRSCVTSSLSPSEAARSHLRNPAPEIHRILHGTDDRLLVIIGPCSIHDPKAASNMRTI